MEEYVFSISGIIDKYYLNRNYVKYFLDKAGTNPVRIKVSSYGGDVAEAVAISNLLAEHKNVTIEFIGFNASAATWMAFGAEKVESHEDSMWLAHKSSVGVDIYGSLNTDQLKSKIQELENAKKSADAIDLMIASKYMDKTGKSLKDLLNLMSESRWMGAAEALEFGFIDAIIPGINKSIKITNELAMNFESMGMPVPVIENKTEDHSLIQVLKDGFNELKSLFPKAKKEEFSNTNTEPIMRKEFVSVNQILNCEGLPENEGKITFTVDQVKLMNDALISANAAKVKAEGDLHTSNEALTASDKKYTDAIDVIDSLSDDVKNAGNVSDKVSVIKNLLDKVPGMKIITPTATNDGKPDFSEVAKDPINNFGNEED